MSKKEHQLTAPIRPGQLSVRRQRIERWAYKGRSTSSNDKVIRSQASLGSFFLQQRTESFLIQADRRLNMDLYQLGEERAKLLKRHNFDQKLFANKQAIRHKDNLDIQRALEYVRKCCKYSTLDNDEEEMIDSTISAEEDRPTSAHRSRSLITNTPETFLHHDDHPKRQVQFEMNTKRSIQSAYTSSRSRLSPVVQPRGKSADVIRTSNFVPPTTRLPQRKEPMKSKRPSSRIFSTKNSLQEFRRYPERFLSSSNRYLPLLRQQTQELHSKKAPILSEGSELLFEEAKSFLSEENEAGKSPMQLHRSTEKFHAPSKISLMETTVEKSSEYASTLCRLREHEYANLQRLIRSNSIGHILKPMTPMKSSQTNQRQLLDLNQILYSNESLRCSEETTKPRRRQSEIEKNRSKLGVLIF